jgi:hypothetical protein
MPGSLCVRLWVKAAAVSEAIGLKAHVNDSLQAHHLNLLPASVAGAAEVREVLGVEAARIKDVGVFQSARPDRGHMLSLTSALEVESCGASRGKLLVFSTRLPQALNSDEYIQIFILTSVV